MENKSSNSNNIVLIIVGLIIVAGISLVVGFSFGKGNSNQNVTEPQKENTTQNEEIVELDEVTALTLVQYLYDDAMEFYTFDAIQNCTWKTDDKCADLDEYFNNPNRSESDGYIRITNYDETMNNVFTENGLKQFETFMKKDLSSSEFLKEIDGEMAAMLPTSGFYIGYSTNNLKVTSIGENEIKATIDVIDAVDESSTTKNIVVKKENGKWLVEEFAIPMNY